MALRVSTGISMVEAVEYAADNGARVINISMGAMIPIVPDLVFEHALTYAARRGILVIVAAGNENREIATYPASLSDVIAVAGLDQADHKASFSSFGSWVDIAAPATQIRTICKSSYGDPCFGGICAVQGTSFSSPVVAGVAALVWAANPALSAAQVRAILLETATPIDHLNPGYEGKLGAGRVNAAAAVARALTPHRAFNNSEARSVSTPQNINIPLRGYVNAYRVTAEIPTYFSKLDALSRQSLKCTTDSSGTEWQQALYTDENLEVVCRRPTACWRPGMRVQVVEKGGVVGDMAEVCTLDLRKRVPDSVDRLPFLSLDSSSQMRPFPFPYEYMNTVCPGSSVLLGGAPRGWVPFADIRTVVVDPERECMDLYFDQGGHAHVTWRVERGKAVFDVTDISIDTLTKPFSTIRSMYESDDKCLLAKARSLTEGPYKVLASSNPADDPEAGLWASDEVLPGDQWRFYRDEYSAENPSGPDLAVEVLSPRGYYLTRQAEAYNSGTGVVVGRQTASAGYVLVNAESGSDVAYSRTRGGDSERRGDFPVQRLCGRGHDRGVLGRGKERGVHDTAHAQPERLPEVAADQAGDRPSGGDQVDLG